MSSRILFVDDDANLLAALQRNLRKQFSFDTALGGPEGLQQLEEHGPYALVVADMRMPGMDGIEFLEKVRQRSPDTVRLMLTGNADQQTAIDAVNRGQVFRFLNKPCPPEELVHALEGGLKQHEVQSLEREMLESTLTGSVKVLADVLGLVAPDALGRGQRLRDSMKTMAKFAGIGPAWELEVAALLSPLGYASLPPSILRKLTTGSALEPSEQRIVRRIPQIGHDLLSGIPRLSEVARIVLYQRKHFDGSGYPDDAVSGEAIPAGARLLSILIDRATLEADGVVKQSALEQMKARAGVYDPRLLDLCFVCFEAFLSQAISHDLPVLSLSVDKLRPGQIVVSDITTRAGTLLIGAGNRLTAMMLQRLQNYDELGQIEGPIFVQEPAVII